MEPRKSGKAAARQGGENQAGGGARDAQDRQREGWAAVSDSRLVSASPPPSLSPSLSPPPSLSPFISPSSPPSLFPSLSLFTSLSTSCLHLHLHLSVSLSTSISLSISTFLSSLLHPCGRELRREGIWKMKTKEEAPALVEGLLRAFPVSRCMHRHQSADDSSQ